ncbi:MAG: hypothetical protein WBC44_10935 [Planctomycetaceae bacterium]
MTEPAFDVAVAHRYFAIELNNAAWDLVEAEHRSSDETDRMVHAAHAALYHWSQIGSLLNRQRGLCLISTTCAAAQRADEAQRYAAECLAVSRQDPDGQTPFDRAIAYGCAARAAGLNNDPNAARQQYATALEIVAGFDDARDAELFSRLYPPP